MTKHILESIRQALGVEADDNTLDKEIMALTPDEQFRLWCQWEGLLGPWDRILKETVLELFNDTK